VLVWREPPVHWHAYNLQPHRPETFKLSRDQAIVRCLEDRSQIQALNSKGDCRAMTTITIAMAQPPYSRALETLEGKVVGECNEGHCHQAFLKFLKN
jgi:hypothetical protein